MFVDRLRRNRTDGASAMARQALGHMAEFVRTAELNADLPGRVRSCCAELARARPSMAAIGNLMEHWAATFSWPEPDSTFKEQALAHVQHVLGQVGRARREAVARAIKVLPDGASILTHSTSGTVRDVLDSFTKIRFRRPRFRAAAQAQNDQPFCGVRSVGCRRRRSRGRCGFLVETV